jgi:uncharacterized membrane protein
LIEPQSCGPFDAAIGTTGISEVGEICGGGGTCGKTESAHFVWYGAPPIIFLPMPAEFPGGFARDMNSSRQVVGQMSEMSSAFGRAYLHHNGTTTDLGWFPDHFYSEADGISEDGVICGTSWHPY